MYAATHSAEHSQCSQFFILFFPNIGHAPMYQIILYALYSRLISQKSMRKHTVNKDLPCLQFTKNAICRYIVPSMQFFHPTRTLLVSPWATSNPFLTARRDAEILVIQNKGRRAVPLLSPPRSTMREIAKGSVIFLKAHIRRPLCNGKDSKKASNTQHTFQ